MAWPKAKLEKVVRSAGRVSCTPERGTSAPNVEPMVSFMLHCPPNSRPGSYFLKSRIHIDKVRIEDRNCSASHPLKTWTGGARGGVLRVYENFKGALEAKIGAHAKRSLRCACICWHVCARRLTPICTARAGEGHAVMFSSDGLPIRAFLSDEGVILPEGVCD